MKLLVTGKINSPRLTQQNTTNCFVTNKDSWQNLTNNVHGIVKIIHIVKCLQKTLHVRFCYWLVEKQKMGCSDLNSSFSSSSSYVSFSKIKILHMNHKPPVLTYINIVGNITFVWPSFYLVIITIRGGGGRGRGAVIRRAQLLRETVSHKQLNSQFIDTGVLFYYELESKKTVKMRSVILPSFSSSCHLLRRKSWNPSTK